MLEASIIDSADVLIAVLAAKSSKPDLKYVESAKNDYSLLKKRKFIYYRINKSSWYY